MTFWLKPEGLTNLVSLFPFSFFFIDRIVAIATASPRASKPEVNATGRLGRSSALLSRPPEPLAGGEYTTQRRAREASPL